LAHVSPIAAGSLLPLFWRLRAWLGLPARFAHTVAWLVPCIPGSRHFTDLLSETLPLSGSRDAGRFSFFSSWLTVFLGLPLFLDSQDASPLIAIPLWADFRRYNYAAQWHSFDGDPPWVLPFMVSLMIMGPEAPFFFLHL
jgi:hypothetical protein